MPGVSAPPPELTELLGPDHVRLATESDSIDGVLPRFVVEPATPTEVARVLAFANTSGLSVIPRGGGTKLAWGHPPRSADLLLALRRLDRVLEHAAGDMTATVEAGCTIDSFQQTLSQHGQRLALDPLWPDRATVGGVLATADSGPLRWSFGAPRDLVIGVTVALADGTLARSGGKVVKNVAGYDLPKLFTGSFGTLGVITQATFRLHPLPAATRDLAFRLRPIAFASVVAAIRDAAPLIAATRIAAAPMTDPTMTVCIESLPEAIDGKLDRVTHALTAAGAIPSTDCPPVPNDVRECLFEPDGPSSLVAKISVLPTQLVDLLNALHCSPRLRHWRLVARPCGVALLRLEAPDQTAFVAAADALAEAVRDVPGTLTLLQCPPALTSRLPVWQDPGSALPLMRRVKEQFDPRCILNPGRFVGGI